MCEENPRMATKAGTHPVTASNRHVDLTIFLTVVTDWHEAVKSTIVQLQRQSTSFIDSILQEVKILLELQLHSFNDRS